MDSIKELFDAIKGRIGSPLFGSFILFWLIFNWPIPVILLFYKQGEYKIGGKGVSFIDAINSQINLTDNFFIPMVLSFAYVIGYPWIKAKIEEWNIFINSASEDKIIKMTKGNSMPMSKYLAKLKVINDKEVELEMLAREKSELNSTINELNVQLDDEVTKHRKSKEKISELQKMNNIYSENNSVKFFDGIWTVSYVKNTERISDVWHFNNGKISNKFGNVIFNIVTINGDPLNKTHFILLDRSEGDKTVFYLNSINSKEYEILDWKGDHYRMIKENQSTNDSYRNTLIH